ncbi:MAG TPA: cytidylate kinase-like family protein [Candidatus Acidoferrum sp.]
MLTIDREYGSGAAEIAQQIADRLGWKLWDQLLTDEVARRLECESFQVERHEERRDPLYYRIFKAFLRGSYEGTLITPQMKMADAENIRRVSEQVVRKAAAEGNAVIVGRGSAYYLKDEPYCFHLFIYAPFEERVRRLKLAGKSEAEATELACNVDRDRADFIKQHFGIKFPARHFFHLMVNSTMGEAAAVQTVLDALSAIQKGQISS